ncbi:PIN domain-containing protein [Hymenobacter sp.]|uniref:type II toxin-antitoxin system VapC family toxin n=1 Tax=Hymenobacter sp. TaxID=1898978 RepID=UPI00286B032F|nr:PIN domain-containing protein [Hymenobacter sp.]
MKRFLLDTNVVLDFLIRREPFAAVAADLFQLAEEGRVKLHVSSLSFSHVFYLLRKSVGTTTTRSLLVDLSEVVAVALVDSRMVNDALRSSFPDFEDAVQYFAAADIPDLAAIVTRDPKGFAAGQLPVLSPAEALRLIS